MRRKSSLQLVTLHELFDYYYIIYPVLTLHHKQTLSINAVHVVQLSLDDSDLEFQKS